MGGMSLRDEFRDFRRQKPFLLGIPGAKMFGHTYLSYIAPGPLTLIHRFTCLFTEGE